MDQSSRTTQRVCMFQRSEPICFVLEGDTSETVESCLSYLTDISEKAFRLLVPRYGMVFEEIQQRLDQDLEEYKDDEEREREEKKHHLYQLKQQLEHCLQELPVTNNYVLLVNETPVGKVLDELVQNKSWMMK